MSIVFKRRRDPDNVSGKQSFHILLSWARRSGEDRYVRNVKAAGSNPAESI